MIEKTDALVLRKIPYSKTSHIVTWLTPCAGKVVTMVKGACRPKSWFLGQYDLAYTCELMFYARERNGLHIAKECSPINIRAPLRADWRRYLCAEYICDMVSRISMPGEHHHEIYTLTETMLDHLCLFPAKRQVLYWFELQLMTALGVAPRLATCSKCGSAPDHGTLPRSHQSRPASWFFSPSHGGILCSSCTSSASSEFSSLRKQAGGRSIRISDRPFTPDVLALMRQWQGASSPRGSQNTKCTPSQLLAFEDLLGIFLAFHLDFLPDSRKMASDLVEADPLTAIGHTGQNGQHDIFMTTPNEK